MIKTTSIRVQKIDNTILRLDYCGADIDFTKQELSYRFYTTMEVNSIAK